MRDTNLREAMNELGHRRRYKSVQTWERRDTEPASQQVRAVRQTLQSGIGRANGVLRMSKQKFASRCQRDLLAQSIEQRSVGNRLQLADLVRQRWLRNAEFVGRLRKAFCFGHCEEIPEVPELHEALT